jgi:hypothetical protein
MACWRASRLEWHSCCYYIISGAVELSRWALAIACCFVFTTAGASCAGPAPRAHAGCNGKAERPIGSDHGKTLFLNFCHCYCRSHGQITERQKGNGAQSGTESLCRREHVHLGKCSDVNSSNFPNLSTILEKFGKVWTIWRNWRKSVRSQSLRMEAVPACSSCS